MKVIKKIQSNSYYLNISDNFEENFNTIKVFEKVFEDFELAVKLNIPIVLSDYRSNNPNISINANHIGITYIIPKIDLLYDEDDTDIDNIRRYFVNFYNQILNVDYPNIKEIISDNKDEYDDLKKYFPNLKIREA